MPRETRARRTPGEKKAPAGTVLRVGPTLGVVPGVMSRRPARFAGTRMRRGIARLGPVVLTAWLATIPALAREPAPEESRLRAHVATLASAEYQGRRGA